MQRAPMRIIGRSQRNFSIQNLQLWKNLQHNHFSLEFDSSRTRNNVQIIRPEGRQMLVTRILIWNF